MLRAPFLLLLALLALVDVPHAPAQIRRELKVGAKVSTPADAVALALKDACERQEDGDDPRSTRYVWVPDWIEPTSGFQQVAHVVNSTITRTSNLVQPRLVTDEQTTLIAIDLDQYAANEKQVPELLKLYDRLAERDSWFNQEVIVSGDTVLEVQREFTPGLLIEIKLDNGTWAQATFKSRKGSKLLCEFKGKPCEMAESDVRLIAAPEPVLQVAKRTFTAQAHLNPEGTELFTLLHADAPLMRLDEWVAFTFSTVNGGLYYELAGVEPSLADTVAKFAGFEAARKVLRQAEVLRLAEELQRKEGAKRSLLAIAAELDQELAKSRAIMNESLVTGRQRSFLFIAGSALAPTEGMQLVSVTYDVGEDNTATAGDPQRNLTVYERYNGGEAIMALPNGELLYLVFDANDKIIATVPDNVAHDYQARRVRGNVATSRVFSGTGCANCHDANERLWGYQPVTNDVAVTLRSISQVLGDRAKRGTVSPDKLQELQRLTSAFGRTDDVQLLELLDRARLGYQRAVGTATGAKSSREVIQGLADAHWGYWYDAVWPEHAAADVAGQWLTRKEAQAWLLRNVDPEPDAHLHDLLREDIVVDRLKRGLSITPAQWRAIAGNVTERHLLTKAKQPPLLEKGPQP
jgi:hypothetical protein